MRKNKLILPLLVLLVMLYGCKKEEKINFEFDNSQDFVPTELDEWLNTLFLNPYNIEVVYRYDRYKGNIERNIAPVREDKVKGQMLAVLDGFLKPYNDVAGTAFIKTFTPKEWVLFGSTSYNNDGSMILGTASGGRNVTLYEVNAFDPTDAEQVRRRLRTIHHEFTHILQQNKTMPLDFEGISEGHYFEEWTNNTLNPQHLSDSLGFVSRYARSQYFEDFAETAAHLLIQGQLWYDRHAIRYNATTYSRLKRKETSVVNYFRDSHNIDFRKLQRELQAVMYESYNDKTFQSLGNWYFIEGLYNTKFSMSLNDPYYISNGFSQEFKEAYDQLVAAFASVASRHKINALEFTFTPSTSALVIRIIYESTAGSSPGTVYNADFNFSYTYNNSQGELTFQKTQQGTGTAYNNANNYLTAFNNSITKYLTESVFVPEWSVDKVELSRRDENFFNTGGFYKKDNRDSYLNFPLVKRTF